ncbi:hypothetical protein DY000_02060739 [Brassica cretica]|uniref:Uncharacterized protein n=1 Tax=Brassica cretica TaxID=69181 RepID=A0ABQ7B431_BRACR|nr:hypothetical protein DY000_02060739 [Brassica cretica]
MTPSSPPLLGRFIFSVRPSSLSLRRLSRSIVFLAQSSLSIPSDRCCVEEAMECFIHSGTHASLSEGFNLIKARGRLEVIYI